MSFQSAPDEYKAQNFQQNRWATFSVFFAVIGVPLSWFTLMFPTIVGIVMAHVAIKQIRTRGGLGYNRAIIGMTIGYGWLTFSAVLVVFTYLGQAFQH